MQHDRLASGGIGEETLEFPVTADGLIGQSFCHRTKRHSLQTGHHLSRYACFLHLGRVVQDEIQGRYARWRKPQGLRLSD